MNTDQHPWTVWGLTRYEWQTLDLLTKQWLLDNLWRVE